MSDDVTHPIPWHVVQDSMSGFFILDSNDGLVATTPSRDMANLIAAAPIVFRTARQLLVGLNAQTIGGMDVGFQNTRNQLQADLDRGTIR